MSTYSLFLIVSLLCGAVAFLLNDSSNTTSRIVYSAVFGIAFGAMAAAFFGTSRR